MSVDRVHVKMGELRVITAEGVLFAVGLGSCVAVALYDRENRVGGLAHVMLPELTGKGEPAAGRYAATAVPKLVEMMVKAGARKAELVARIAGGAAMFADILPAAGVRLGERNVGAVKAALVTEAIPLMGEDVGGAHGRSVFFDAQDGSLVVRSVQRPDVFL